MPSRIVGVGAYLPSAVVSNADLERLSDTTDAWIVGRTGIRTRRRIAENETVAEMAAAAAKDAVQAAGVAVDKIGMIVVASVTPDTVFPSLAVRVQAMLGNRNAFAFDVRAAGAGFIYALAVADNAIKAGQTDAALVVGSEAMSRLIDYADRATCALFGDGAGAVVLCRAEDNDESRVIAVDLYSDGRLHDALYTDGDGHVKMNGKEVFSFAVDNMSSAVGNLLRRYECSPSDVRLLVARQSDERTVKAVAAKTGIDAEKAVFTMGEYADTLSASIPLALTKAIKNGKITKGDLTVITSMGSGFAWGASLIRW